MSETVLVLNAGSSSIKFQLYEIGEGESLRRRFKGQMGGIGSTARSAASTPWTRKTACWWTRRWRPRPPTRWRKARRRWAAG